MAGGRPEMDPQRVRAAYTQARKLVEAIGTGEDNTAYLRAVDEMIAPVESFDTVEELGDFLAYTLYGETLFALGAVLAAESGGGFSREQVYRIMDAGLEAILSERKAA
jgi:hypothetical protein